MRTRPPESTYDTPAGRRAGFVATLVLAMLVGVFPGNAFGALGPFLIDDFGLSRVQLGLATTVFFAVGGGGSLLAGPFVDRVGGRRVMLWAFGLMGAAFAGMALAPNYRAFCLMAAVAGLALATSNPTTNKVIAQHVSQGRRGVVMGMKQSGVQVGTFLAGAVLPPLAAALGWQLALGLCVILPVIGLSLAWLRIPRDEDSTTDAPRSLTSILPRSVWWLTTYSFLMGGGIAAISAYLPLFAVEALDFTPQAAGAVAATVGFIGIGSRVIAGWASEKSGSYSTSLLLMTFGSIGAVALFLAAQEGATFLVWPAGVLLAWTAVAFNAVAMLALVAESGSAAAGTASGYVLSGFYGGFVLSPVFFGMIVDRTESYTPAWILVGALYVLAAIVILMWRRELASS